MTDDERDRKGKFLDNQSKFILSQGFDSIIIMATHHDKAAEHTSYWTRGDGNWLARYGQVREWVVREESKMANGESRTQE